MKIGEKIYQKRYDGFPKITVGSLPSDLLPTDEIVIDREESFFSENMSWDAHTWVYIIRERDETDEEKEKRLLENEKRSEASKKHRYETYLKLKKEFDVQKEGYDKYLKSEKEIE